MNEIQIEKMNALITQLNPALHEETFAPKGGGGRTWIKFHWVKNSAGDTMKVVVASKTVTTILGAGEAGDEGRTVSSSHSTYGDKFKDCLRCIQYQKSGWRNPKLTVSESEINNFLGL